MMIQPLRMQRRMLLQLPSDQDRRGRTPVEISEALPVRTEAKAPGFVRNPAVRSKQERSSHEPTIQRDITACRPLRGKGDEGAAAGQARGDTGLSERVHERNPA